MVSAKCVYKPTTSLCLCGFKYHNSRIILTGMVVAKTYKVFVDLRLLLVLMLSSCFEYYKRYFWVLGQNFLTFPIFQCLHISG